MRVWPYSVTSVTEKIEITAPAARIVAQIGVAGDVLQDLGEPGLAGLRGGEPLHRLGGQPRDGHQHVETVTMMQRADDRAGHRLLRVPHLLAGRRDGIQADEGEEDRPGRGADAGEPDAKKFAKWSALNAVNPMTMNIASTPSLMQHHDRVDPWRTRRPRGSAGACTAATSTTAGRLMMPPVAAPSSPGSDETDSAVGQLRPEQVVQQLVEVAAPSDRDAPRRDAVLEQHAAGDDDRHALAERVVGERVGRAAHRDRRWPSPRSTGPTARRRARRGGTR